MTTTSIEIICIGNELLIGKTLNTNARWLAKRITALGLKTHRITIIGDSIEEISNALREAIQRNPHFIITTGGLGPTFDDKTLEGIAMALERKLAIRDQALKMIEEKYRQYVEEGRMERAELTPPHIKMARLPEGAKPIFNPVGTAPAVIIKHDDITVIALPGVPSEMKGIFDESVAPLLKEAAGEVTFFETSLDVTGMMEPAVAPLIDRVMHDNPYVYIKSHPKGEETVSHLELHLSTTAEETDLAKKRVGKALIQLSELIQEKGGKVKPVKAKS
ncbi:MAG: nicotinamide mononucleotide deamidase-related protein [Candidatus Bathyarchaeota archaeon]|nr:nicotinamide mononucleotide deamidase-related protein [Candidatus Bathyarchaeota archaeon]MDH5532542.1 nicotinamide mononucleotide deamidase-related protein [Candidatus Bathyarchaeota archaeon]MDH5713059.1 nicotinamide mononucleotide deamidase-related protein [Candidatus Bathyarchaeota archaeon]